MFIVDIILGSAKAGVQPGYFERGAGIFIIGRANIWPWKSVKCVAPLVRDMTLAKV